MTQKKTQKKRRRSSATYMRNLRKRYQELGIMEINVRILETDKDEVDYLLKDYIERAKYKLDSNK